MIWIIDINITEYRTTRVSKSIVTRAGRLAWSLKWTLMHKRLEFVANFTVQMVQYCQACFFHLMFSAFERHDFEQGVYDIWFLGVKKGTQFK